VHRVGSLGVLLVVAACGGGDAGRPAETDSRSSSVAGSSCLGDSRIGSEGVGAVRVRSRISSLPDDCVVQDTVIQRSGDEKAHRITSGSASVIAFTAGSTDTISRIEIEDRTLQTPERIGVGSTTGTFRTVHAPFCALVGTDGRVTLFAEDMPGVEFATTLAAPTDPLRARAMEEDSRLIPDDASIIRITITGRFSPCSGPTVAFNSVHALEVKGGEVRVDTFWSPSLGVKKELVVYLPASYGSDRARRYPLVILLHGLWGDQWQWVRSERLAITMDSMTARGLPEMIIAMPDGDDGWWTTWTRLVDMRGCMAQPRRRRHTPASDPAAAEPAASYCVPWAKYDDYVARDLVAYMDSTYRTTRSAAQRGIAGLSMGGYGAISIALAYPETFSAAASHSGRLSLTYIGDSSFVPPGRFAASTEEIRDRHPSLWWSLEQPFADLQGFKARDPATYAERVLSRRDVRPPSLFIDVGTSDFLLGENRAFHHRLNELGYPHSYAEWPGGHTHSYWQVHIRESLRWFARQFERGPSR
jgi:putative tributyrin esterase